MALADVLNSQSVNNTSVTTLGMDLSKGKRAIYWISLASTVAGTGTLDGRLQGSANSNFTGNTNLVGTNLTQLTTNNTVTSVEIRADQLTQANNLYRYVRLQLTDATNAATCSVLGFLTDAEQSPASQYNLNTTYLATQVVSNQ